MYIILSQTEKIVENNTNIVPYQFIISSIITITSTIIGAFLAYFFSTKLNKKSKRKQLEIEILKQLEEVIDNYQSIILQKIIELSIINSRIIQISMKNQKNLKINKNEYCKLNELCKDIRNDFSSINFKIIARLECLRKLKIHEEIYKEVNDYYVETKETVMQILSISDEI